jgi:uncharacterized protein (DUF1800 family)
MRSEAVREFAPAQEVDPIWAWKPYEPVTQRPWDLRQAGHLFRRAGFGAGWAQLQQALKDGPSQTIDRLLRPEADVAGFNRSYDQFEEAATDSGSGSVENLSEWWLRRMIDTPNPLLEKMTLFWHSFFGTTNAKVLSGMAMVRHVRLLREHALGTFPPLLEAVCQDPATLVSNGAAQNYKAKPNQSFPRAVLDCFTLGPGNYSASDLQETARTFTGWFVVRQQLRYNAYEHDEGRKRILGQEGNWKPQDALRILLQQPALPRLIARKLYRWLISETQEPAPELIAPLAEILGRDCDVGKLVGVILRSNLFFSPVAYRQKVKGPVDYALNIAKGLEGVIPTRPLGHALADLGQALGQPPTVHGWEGGRAWINPCTLIGRNNLAWAMLVDKEPYGNKLNPQAAARKHGQVSPSAAARFLLDVFLQGDVPADVQQASEKAAGEIGTSSDGQDQWLRRFCHLVVTLPEFQLE